MFVSLRSVRAVVEPCTWRDGPLDDVKSHICGKNPLLCKQKPSTSAFSCANSLVSSTNDRSRGLDAQAPLTRRQGQAPHALRCEAARRTKTTVRDRQVIFREHQRIGHCTIVACSVHTTSRTRHRLSCVRLQLKDDRLATCCETACSADHVQNQEVLLHDISQHAAPFAQSHIRTFARLYIHICLFTVLLKRLKEEQPKCVSETVNDCRCKDVCRVDVT
jgi:hypothetical protein